MGLGFDAARGYALADQTSPALAGAAGALTDTAMTGERVTELRIHGVSGSNGPTMLEHPQALQVAGDGVAGFFRRWSPDGPGQPSVPWKLEAYSWGGADRGAAGLGVLADAGPVHDVQRRLLHAAAHRRGQ